MIYKLFALIFVKIINSDEITSIFFFISLGSLRIRYLLTNIHSFSDYLVSLLYN